MFDGNDANRYSVSRTPLAYLFVAGAAGLSVYFGDETFASFIEPLKNYVPDFWRPILLILSVALIAAGLTRRVFTIRGDGPIQSTLNLLWIIPISREEYPRSHLRHIDISFEKTLEKDTGTSGLKRREYYVLKLVFEDFTRIEIMRSTRREKVVEEAERIQGITGARLG